MAFGTLLALFPGGRRRGTEPVSAPVGKAPVVAAGPPQADELSFDGTRSPEVTPDLGDGASTGTPTKV